MYNISDDYLLKNIYQYVYNNYNLIFNENMEKIINCKNTLSNKVNEEFYNSTQIEKNSIVLSYLIYLKYLIKN